MSLIRTLFALSLCLLMLALRVSGLAISFLLLFISFVQMELIYCGIAKENPM